MTQQEWMEKLKGEGVKDLGVVVKPANTTDTHTHDQATVHVMLEGQVTITDTNGDGQIHVYKAGDYLEIPAETTHTVVFGPQGLTMIVGIKK